MDDQQEQEQFEEPNVGESNLNEQNDIPINSTPRETKSSTPTVNSRKLILDVWNHFKRQKIDGNWKVVCNYCKKKLLGDGRQGTSHLRNHFKTCKLRTTRDIKQEFLKTRKVENETVIIGNYVFNQQTTRHALRKMIILHEYLMSMVDNIGFKEFCCALQPLFKVVSRNSIKNDIMKEYNEEKEKIKLLLSRIQSQVVITTDMWTASNQNKGYMTITTHFIDDLWRLQS